MKLTNAKLANIQGAVNELLGIPGVETLFALRLAHILEATTPLLSAYKKTREKQVDDAILRDEDGVRVPELDTDENPTGNYQIDPLKLDDLNRRLETLADAGVAATIPQIKLSAVDELITEYPENPETEKGRGWVIYALRPILDLDLEGADEEFQDDPKPDGQKAGSGAKG